MNLYMMGKTVKITDHYSVSSVNGYVIILFYIKNVFEAIINSRVMHTELQIRGVIEDNSLIIFLISQ